MWQGSIDERRVDDVSNDRRLSRRETADVLRDAPQLGLREEFLIQEIAERRHRRAVQPGAQAVVDVPDSAAAIEAPAFVQVRREHRVAGVILERGSRRPVAAALIAVTLATADRVIELAAYLQGVGAGPASRLLTKRERLRRQGRIGKKRREGLDVCEHVVALAVGQP